MVKATFTLDELTLDRLNRAAKRESRPKSEVVRDAIRDYERRTDRVSEEERLRRVAVAERIMNDPPTRPRAEAERELRELRRSRRTGWSRPSDPK